MMKRHVSIGILSTQLLTACGDGTPPFQDVEAGRYHINVGTGLDSEEPTNASYPIENGEEVDGDPIPVEDLIEKALNEDGSFGDEIQEADSTEDGTEAKRLPSKSDGSAENGEDRKAAQLCGQIFKGKAKRVVLLPMNNRQEALNLDSETVLAVRLTGNQPSLDMNIAGIESMAGICILVSGNQPRITLQSDIDIGELVYLARGNQSSARITFTNDHTLKSSLVDLRGNNHAITFEGAGTSPCEDALIRGGSAHTLKCE